MYKKYDLIYVGLGFRHSWDEGGCFWDVSSTDKSPGSFRLQPILHGSNLTPRKVGKCVRRIIS